MPVMMYGYGGYAASMPPTFQNMVTGTDVVDWVRKGRMYVHCIIRGGSEYGVKWHEAGMLKNKKHVFEDFIDIAQWLVDSGMDHTTDDYSHRTEQWRSSYDCHLHHSSGFVWNCALHLCLTQTCFVLHRMTEDLCILQSTEIQWKRICLHTCIPILLIIT